MLRPSNPRATPVAAVALLLGAVLGGCGGAERAEGAAPTVGHDLETPVVVCIRGGDVAELPEGVTPIGNADGGRVIVRATGASLAALPKPWRVVLRFGELAAYAKLRSAAAVVAAPAEGFDAFLKLSEEAAALCDEDVRATLGKLGFAVATRAGDVVTGRAVPTRLEALLASESVVSLRMAGRVRTR